MKQLIVPIAEIPAIQVAKELEKLRQRVHLLNDNDIEKVNYHKSAQRFLDLTRKYIFSNGLKVETIFKNYGSKKWFTYIKNANDEIIDIFVVGNKEDAACSHIWAFISVWEKSTGLKFTV